MTKNLYVLVLPSWYPSKVDTFNGDFNQRTVEALSGRLRQIVVYVVPDKLAKTRSEEVETDGELTTIRSYFPKSSFKIFDLLRYLIIYYNLVNNIIKQNGKPSYIHTYVFFPAGIISFYFAKKLKIKNVLTEHWSIIYPDNDYSILKQNLFSRIFLKYILRSFDLILPVVEALEKAINFWTPKVKKVVISNVVNTSLFFFTNEGKYENFTFLHVSSMESHKDPLGIIESFESDVLLNQNATLKLIGPIRNELFNRVNQSSVLKERVEFLGELPNSEVAKVMQKSHILVMNSLYESQPCVILEALCCGLPIVSTNVGGISEIVNADNGILFKKGGLVASLEKIVNMYPSFNRREISENAETMFSSRTVSKRIIDALAKHKIIEIN